MRPVNEGTDAEKKKREEMNFIVNVFILGICVGACIIVFITPLHGNAPKPLVVDIPTNSTKSITEKLGVKPVEIVSLVFNMISTLGSWLGVILAVLIYYRMPRDRPVAPYRAQ